ncbi:hypothetical protein QX249_17355 [Vibrio parahaemolyticus]|uniref:Uncharacterized protein n=1 Tax=Vibrio parahaemolyticus TaxID=670 RepID=A0AAW8Q1W8_VIBPH|nr:hypothetical protein [Vibrio parahaemolyticus]MDS1822407.1 hypothetical protein [Vibrio parahaemolyticus]
MLESGNLTYQLANGRKGQITFDAKDAASFIESCTNKTVFRAIDNPPQSQNINGTTNGKKQQTIQPSSRPLKPEPVQQPKQAPKPKKVKTEAKLARDAKTDGIYLGELSACIHYFAHIGDKDSGNYITKEFDSFIEFANGKYTTKSLRDTFWNHVDGYKKYALNTMPVNVLANKCINQHSR